MILRKEIKSKGNFNIIVRTAGRPNYFRDCIKSIRKHAPNAVIHVISDRAQDKKYIDKYCPEANYYLVDKLKVANVCRKIKIQRRPFIYNYYFNLIDFDGWTLIVDDDNEMVSSVELPKDKDEMYLYKVDLNTRVIPSQEKVVFKDIDSGCAVFHKSKMVKWSPQKGGDFLFIQEMANNLNVSWRKEIIVKVQETPHFGKLVDKAR